MLQYFFSEIAKKYPDNIRPENVLKFTDILTISAKEKLEDVELVKNRVRKLIDVMVQLENSENVSNIHDVYNNLKDALSEKGPNLV
jgi:DNA-binding TFAR19-related protein (PDSD5 family)